MKKIISLLFVCLFLFACEDESGECNNYYFYGVSAAEGPSIAKTGESITITLDTGLPDGAHFFETFVKSTEVDTSIIKLQFVYDTCIKGANDLPIKLELPYTFQATETGIHYYKFHGNEDADEFVYYQVLVEE